MDMSQFSDDQVNVALKAIESAKKHGLNPDFVLPMIQVESNFDPKAESKTGAYGPMQISAGLAKDNKIDPKDVDANIETGMKFLKSLYDNDKLEKDPYKILAAYNAGPNHKFFKTGDLSDLPDETINHVMKVRSAYGGELPSVASESQDQVEENPEKQYGDTIVGGNEPTAEEKKRSKQEAGVMGGLAGAGVGTLYSFKKPAVQVLQKVGLWPGGNSAINAADLATSAPMAQPQASNKITLGGPGTGVQNYGTNLLGMSPIEAARATGMGKGEGEIYDIKNQISAANKRLANIGINPQTLGMTDSGVILPQSRQAAKILSQQPSQQPAPPPPSQPGVLSRLTGKLAGSSPVMGALSGYGAASNAQDAYNKATSGDTPGAVKSTIGALANLGALIPKTAPYAGSASSAIEADRRLNDKDYVGAATSTLGAVAPYVAPFLLGPEVGIPVGIATALGSPIANEAKDWLMNHLNSSKSP